MADFLLNYMTLAGAVLVFIAAAGVLTFGRNQDRLHGKGSPVDNRRYYDGIFYIYTVDGNNLRKFSGGRAHTHSGGHNAGLKFG